MISEASEWGTNVAFTRKLPEFPTSQINGPGPEMSPIDDDELVSGE
jgi:hypothetical protein